MNLGHERIARRAAFAAGSLRGSLCLPLLFFLFGCVTPATYKDPDALGRLIAHKDVAYFLIDVRTPQEYASGHIPTAANIPVTAISSNPPAAGKDALIIVYCASGARSSLAARRLQALGFTQVVDFGSISRWKGSLAKGTD